MQIDIVSGFFGAGKTTFINKYLQCLDSDVALIENEFGDIGIDAKLINNDIKIKEINSGCICCTLQMDFRDAINEIYNMSSFDRVIIEPSGIGKLSSVVSACDKARELDNIDINVGKKIIIVDASSFLENIEDFGTFYTDQITCADIIFLNRTEGLTEISLSNIIEMIEELNNKAMIYSDDFRQKSNSELLDIINNNEAVTRNDYIFNDYELKIEAKQLNDDCIELESVTINTSKIFMKDDLLQLERDIKDDSFGNIIRAKGILNSEEIDKKWHFDYALNHFNVEMISKQTLMDSDARIIFIGEKLKNKKIEKLK